tara:strand:- start:79 stop:426 length:348 start_codon:yes stop_codon:yes gene_type:complete
MSKTNTDAQNTFNKYGYYIEDNVYSLQEMEDVFFTLYDICLSFVKKNKDKFNNFTGNILRQPMCRNIEKKVLKQGYPNADRVMAQGVLLPLHHGMTESMFARFQATVQEFVDQYG